jgi:phospholipase D1/2
VKKTEQIYIHSKLMIIDDRITVVGSANINDRSMLGKHDSEIALVIEEPESEWIASKMNGQLFMVSKFSHTLRCNLFREHLGLDPDDEIVKGDSRSRFACDCVLTLGVDPVLEDFYKGMWQRISNNNTRAFESNFKDIPKNSYHTLAEYDSAHKSLMSEFTEWLPKKQMSDVQGHLVEHPLDFLKNESLAPTAAQKEGWVSKKVFL